MSCLCHVKSQYVDVGWCSRMAVIELRSQSPRVGMPRIIRILLMAFATHTTATTSSTALPSCSQTCFNNTRIQCSTLGCSSPKSACLCKNLNFGYGLRDCANGAAAQSSLRRSLPMDLRTVPLLRLRLDLRDIGVGNANPLALQPFQELLPSYQVQEGVISFE